MSAVFHVLWGAAAAVTGALSHGLLVFVQRFRKTVAFFQVLAITALALALLFLLFVFDAGSVGGAQHADGCHEDPTQVHWASWTAAQNRPGPAAVWLGYLVPKLVLVLPFVIAIARYAKA
jgi:hypothetical protein